MRFDADTIYTYSYVYAEIYVSADGTAWELLYSTQDFDIWGSDPDDDYEVETELVSGYSTGLYDVLIELYDADTGELVDEFGPNESPEFSLLPLEDSGRDGALVPPPDSLDDDHDHDGGGGAVSWLGLAGLLGALALRRRRRAGLEPVSLPQRRRASLRRRCSILRAPFLLVGCSLATLVSRSRRVRRRCIAHDRASLSRALRRAKSRKSKAISTAHATATGTPCSS